MFKKKILIGIVLLLSLSMTAKSEVKISFEISFTEPQAHYADVEMNISGVNKEYVDVKMPVWAPGSYLVREFSKNVEGFNATSGGKALRFEKVRKNTWRIYGGNKAIRINYRVYANEVSVRTAFIDNTHAFLSSTGIFMYPEGYLKSPSTVNVIPFEGWSKVSTSLEPIPGKQFSYTAPNFDILFDSPLEVGNQDVFEFTAAGVRHEVAMYGGGNYDKERLKVDMAKIVEQATAIYGENPNKHYTFIVHNFLRGGGGLEHLSSTVLGASHDQYGTEKGYNGFLSLVAHEYHHLWNVKRMRPVALGPFDYDNENYTTNLWIAEGFTAYYENKFMLRAGFTSPEEFVVNLVTSLATVENTPGTRMQSAAMSSYDAWIKYYRPNENSNNTGVSYYSKGEVIGMLMDLAIVHATSGTKSLDDVMKAMYLQCKTLKRGYTDAEFKAMVEKVSGTSFTAFWEKYINGTDPVDYKTFFGYAGLDVNNTNEGKQVPYLGIATAKKEGKIYITAVSRNSAAWTSGLNFNDEVVAVNGVPAEPAVEKMAEVTGKKVNDVVKFTIIRDGLTKEFNVTLKASPNIELGVSVSPGATAAQKAVLKKWMGI
jgi:predicted metalloprotease with PDZ domain